jgi:phenylalanyl-tRNA synthetase beta chain
MLAYNLNRGSDQVRLFESGNVFEREGTKATQRKQICLGMTSPPSQKTQGWSAHDGGFFDLKGDVENLLHAFEWRRLDFDAQVAEYYRSGHAARALVDGAVVAQFGQIDPEIASSRKLRQDIFIAEMYLDQLYRHGLRSVRYQALPRFPAVERDFSFVFEDGVVFEKIYQSVMGFKQNELRKFVPVEVFRGGSVAAGKYSILLRATFQSHERTLREEEVARWSGQIIEALEGLGGKLRA